MKVKFDLEIVRPEDPFGDREDPGAKASRRQAMNRPAPSTTSSSRRRGTLTRTPILPGVAEIVEGARLELDNSRELISGIKHIYLLVGPRRGDEPAASGADRGRGQAHGRLWSPSAARRGGAEEVLLEPSH